MDEADSLAREVYECLKKQLGPEHPSTTRSWCRVAAVLDLKRQPTLAEEMYRKCLAQAISRLGPSNPSVFSIRDNLARCLLGQGRKQLARNEYGKLREDIGRYPVLYSKAVERRVDHFLNGTGSLDEYELDLHLSKRNTIGVLGPGDRGDDWEESGDEFSESEYWETDGSDFG